MGDDLLFDLSAASWRHGHADEQAYIEALAVRLEKSLPGLVHIERDRRWLAKTHHVIKIEVLLEGERYTLTAEAGRFVARKSKSVRDIVISSKELSLQEWLQELSQALSEYAHQHEDAQRSLEDFLL